MYTVNDRVSFSRIGRDGKIGVAELVNCLQDCALFHSEDIGHSAAFLAKKHRAWLVSAWDVVFVRRPSMGEEILVHTWPYKMTNLFGHRNFLVETKEKEVLAYADSSVPMNAKSPRSDATVVSRDSPSALRVAGSTPLLRP